MLKKQNLSIGFVFLASRKFDNPLGLSNSGRSPELSDFHDTLMAFQLQSLISPARTF